MAHPQWSWIAAQLASRQPANDPLLEARWAELEVFIRANACDALSPRLGIVPQAEHSPFAPIVSMLAEASDVLEGKSLTSSRVYEECDLLFHIANLAWVGWIREAAEGHRTLSQHGETVSYFFNLEEKMARDVIANHWGPIPDQSVYVRPLTARDLAVCLRSPIAHLRECTIRLMSRLPLAPEGQVVPPAFRSAPIPRVRPR